MGTFVVGLLIHLLMVCWDEDVGNGDEETGNQTGTWGNLPFSITSVIGNR